MRERERQRLDVKQNSLEEIDEGAANRVRLLAVFALAVSPETRGCAWKNIAYNSRLDYLRLDIDCNPPADQDCTEILRNGRESENSHSSHRAKCMHPDALSIE